MEIYLAPPKSLVAIVVVCALSAAALWIGRTPSATPAVGADNPSLDSRAPSPLEANVAVTVPVSPMNGAHRK